jgi:protein-tyrosine-phosphatase
MPHIMIVCTANICRSPVGAALLRRRLAADPETAGWTVSSAGTWALVGKGAASNSIAVMAELGLDITDHRAQLVTSTLMAGADLILCMESGHAEALRVEFPSDADRVFLLSEMTDMRYSISDPYGGPLPEYVQMATDVERLIDEGFSRIKELASAGARRHPQA